jgi:hypothetical protein
MWPAAAWDHCDAMPIRSSTLAVTVQENHNDCGRIAHGTRERADAAPAAIKKDIDCCRSRCGSFDYLSKERTAMEDPERRTAIQWIADALLGALRERVFAPPVLPKTPVPTVDDHLALRSGRRDMAAILFIPHLMSLEEMAINPFLRLASQAIDD